MKASRGPTKLHRAILLNGLARRFKCNAALYRRVALGGTPAALPAGPAEAPRSVSSERLHASLFQHLGQVAPGGVEDGIAAHVEGHGKSGGNALRAAVLGASDGLLSNFNLVMGVAGANLAPKTILLTGLAGLLAGGISMGLGEWISVQSSRELYLQQIHGERDEIATAPARETAELALIYQARGFDRATSRTMATRMMSNPDTALDAMTRDELGIDPSRLGGSAWEAAIVSCLLFMAGALIPVVPYMFLSGATAAAVSAGASAIGLFVIGGAITLFTGKSVLWSGLRQVAFGLVAAVVVFLIGHLIGARLGH